MITIEYARIKTGSLVAHTDCLRILNKTFRRAGYFVNYSNGMGKHVNIKMTQPLPFGILSSKEYVTADLEVENLEEFLLKFNAAIPPFLKAKVVYSIEKNPNLSALIIASKYFIKTTKAKMFEKELKEYLNKFEIETKKDEKLVIKDVSNLIYDFVVTDDGIFITCSFGANNLRIDNVVNTLNSKFNLDIDYIDVERIDQLINTSKDNKLELISVDSFLETIKTNKYVIEE